MLESPLRYSPQTSMSLSEEFALVELANEVDELRFMRKLLLADRTKVQCSIKVCSCVIDLV